jgi:hypothetical protein
MGQLRHCTLRRGIFPEGPKINPVNIYPLDVCIVADTNHTYWQWPSPLRPFQSTPTTSAPTALATLPKSIVITANLSRPSADLGIPPASRASRRQPLLEAEIRADSSRNCRGGASWSKFVRIGGASAEPCHVEATTPQHLTIGRLNASAWRVGGSICKKLSSRRVLVETEVRCFKGPEFLACNGRQQIVSREDDVVCDTSDQLRFTLCESRFIEKLKSLPNQQRGTAIDTMPTC